MYDYIVRASAEMAVAPTAQTMLTCSAVTVGNNRQSAGKLKQERSILSGILPVMGGGSENYRQWRI